MKPNTMIIVEDSKIVVEKLTKLLEPLKNLEIKATADEADNAVKLIREVQPEYNYARRTPIFLRSGQCASNSTDRGYYIRHDQ